MKSRKTTTQPQNGVSPFGFPKMVCPRSVPHEMDSSDRSWDFKKLTETDNGAWFLDHKGRILAYEFQGNQKGAIGFRMVERKSIDGTSLPEIRPFIELDESRFFSSWIKPYVIDLIVDAHGVYVVGPKDHQCYTLLDKSIDGFSNMLQGGYADSSASIVVASGKTVTIYRLEKSDSSPSGFALVQGQVLDIEIELGSIGNFFMFVGDVDWDAPTDWTWVSKLSEKEYRIHRKRSTDEKPVSYTFERPNEWVPEKAKLNYGPATTAAECALSLLAHGSGKLMNTPDLVPFESVIEDMWSAAPMLAVMAILAAFLTYAMASVRRLTMRQQIVWSLIGFVSGFGAALAVLAIYPQVHFVDCAGCRRKRRVDRDRCENCNAEWELPATEGIEIVEPWENNRESRELVH